MAAERKPDRRVERTYNALRDALMALIIEKGYDAISIQDIADRANVARATFYLHFRDKDDLMFRSMQTIYENLVMHQGHGATWESWADDADFQHVAQYADFYTAMLSAKGSMGFLTRVRGFLQEMLEKAINDQLPTDVVPRLPVPMIAAFCTGAQIGLIWWWVENRLPVSAEQMGVYAMQLSVFGLNWALGGKPVDPDNLPPVPQF